MPDDAIDTSETLEITQSTGEMLLVTLGGAVFLALAAYNILYPYGRGDSLRMYIIWASVPLFGLVFLVGLRRLLAFRGTVLALSPQGLKDIRLSPAIIPWPSIRKISTWSFLGNSSIMLVVDPQVEARLGVSPMGRWSRGPNRMLGADGLAVTTLGLKITHDRLLALVQAYAEAHGHRR